MFQPAQLTVYQGDQVTLHFLGVQGPSHTITVEGQADKFVLRRGERHSVPLSLTPSARSVFSLSIGSPRWQASCRVTASVIPSVPRRRQTDAPRFKGASLSYC